MNLVELILLAVALGVDCLVVSFSQGLVFNTNKLKNSLALAFTMGIFQGGMPFIGYIGATLINKYVSAFSNWIVFVIFFMLGAKFIYEALQNKENEGTICCIGLKCLISMGIATSIDAMGAGVNLRFTNADLLFSVFTIGFASFIMSLIGFCLGNAFKHLPSKYLEITGGIILIGLAVKAIL